MNQTEWEKEFDRRWPNQTKSREDLMALFGNEYKPQTATEAMILEQSENKRQDWKKWISWLIAKAETDAKREEALLWMKGLRCPQCGGNKNPDPLATMCTNCYEEA